MKFLSLETIDDSNFSLEILPFSRAQILLLESLGFTAKSFEL